MDHLTTTVTGSLLLAGASMWWLGWVLLPVKIGEFFAPGDFGAVHRRLHSWIWLFRIHLFGHLVTVMALVALVTLLGAASARVLLWPSAAVLAAGLVVACLAAAFYYHFGAWGAIDTAGKPSSEPESLVASLKVPTEYVTCLVRFGRVFYGLGQVVLAAGLLLAGAGPAWLAIVAAALGIAAMALTMGRPDDLHLYGPVFHLNVVWLAAAGVLVLQGGLAVAPGSG